MDINITAVHKRGDKTAEAFVMDLCALAQQDSFCVKIEADAEVADFLLDHNPRNRNPAMAYVRSLSSDVGSGEFRLNGETIIISPEGELVDGQNRMRAVVATGTPITTFATFGIPVEMRSTIGLGRKWTIGDMLSSQGVAHYNTVASMARLVWSIEKQGTVATNSALKGTATVIEKYALDNRELFEEASKFATSVQSPLAAGSPVAAMYAILVQHTKASINEIETFLTQLGQGGDDVSPAAQAYREMMEKYAKNELTGRNLRIELMYHTWNAYRRGTAPVTNPRVLTGSLPQLAL